MAGIPFYVEPSFLIFLGIIMLMDVQRWHVLPRAGLLGFIIFFSLLLHEAAHALTARLFGYRNIRVTLVALGGLTHHPPATRGQSLLITLAGPLATIALAAAAWGMFNLRVEWMQRDVSRFIALTFSLLNLAWAVFNLLPIFPMDGGKVVLCLLMFLMRESRALLCTACLSLAVSVGVGAYFLLVRHLSASGNTLILFYLLVTFIGMNVQIIANTWRR